MVENGERERGGYRVGERRRDTSSVKRGTSNYSLVMAVVVVHVQPTDRGRNRARARRREQQTEGGREGMRTV